MECPCCDNTEVNLKNEEVERKYKGKNLIVTEFFYKCDSCGFEYTTTEVDEMNIKEVKTAYSEMLEKLIQFIKEKY